MLPSIPYYILYFFHKLFKAKYIIDTGPASSKTILLSNIYKLIL